MTGGSMIDSQLLMTGVYHALKCNSLNGENWEAIICDAMGGTHIPGDVYLADGVLDNSVLNIKSLHMKPVVLKTKKGRDFISDPDRFSRRPEIVQRRIGLIENNDQTDNPTDVMQETVENFKHFEKQSFDAFGCDNTLDVVILHGKDYTGNFYYVDVYLFDHEHPDINQLEVRSFEHSEKSKYSGVKKVVAFDNNANPVVARNSSKTGHQQNCYLIYKNLDKAHRRLAVKIPVPEPVSFDMQRIMKEIENDSEILYQDAALLSK